MVVISLYDSYGKDSLKYILNHGLFSNFQNCTISRTFLFECKIFIYLADIKAVFLDKFQRLLNILEIEHDLPHLNMVVYFDEFSQLELEKLKSLKSNLKIISYKQLLVL